MVKPSNEKAIAVFAPAQPGAKGTPRAGRLDLDDNRKITGSLGGFVEGRDPNTCTSIWITETPVGCEPETSVESSKLLQIELFDGSRAVCRPIQPVVVDHYEGAAGSDVNVDFDGVGAATKPVLDGFNRVFRCDTRRSPVSDGSNAAVWAEHAGSLWDD